MNAEHFREFLERSGPPLPLIVEALLRQEARLTVLFGALTEFLHETDIVDRERYDPHMVATLRDREEEVRFRLRARCAREITRGLFGTLSEDDVDFPGEPDPDR
jgi:hypothetical protein